ncbi:MAG: 4-(cytidine 5'-diphospho)-2-C-methyl-D-erythritol kinase [Carboxydocellales bacterium]
MSQKLVLPARAKINLTLDVLGKRPDGYHQVEMVMQTVSLADTITLEETTEEILVSCTHPEVPLNEGNLAFRAAMLLKQAVSYNGGVTIHIDKQIPIAAGLAGGSSNAATVLIGLNSLWDLKLSREDLMHIGSALGSDIPFCIMGGTALASGRGEKVTPLKATPELTLVLIKPNFGVATAQVYGNFRQEQVANRPATQAMLKAIESGDSEAIIRLTANVLESVTLKMHPEIGEIKARLAQAGAKGVLMSGSGPTVFGFVEDEEQGREVAAQLKDLGSIYLAKTC